MPCTRTACPVSRIKMKLCFVSHSAGNGGAERVFLETIELLHTQGVECRVVLPDQGPFCDELAALGIPYSVISYPMWMTRGKVSAWARVKASLNLLKDTLQVAWLISRWKCDVVYSNTATICVGAFAAGVVGRPHVWHLHEFGLEDQGLSFLLGDRQSLEMINRLSSRCICVSHALRKKYEHSIDPYKIAVIYPSMHRGLEREIGSSDEIPIPRAEKFRCVIVGALIEGKGQRDAVLALAHLKKSGLPVELLIVGQGEARYRHSLDKLVTENNLGHEVTFIHQVSNSLPVMRSANVILVCSRSEAFGRVTVEGMYSGRPVIGARAAATAELIKDGVTGLLYSQGDPSDLAGKIEYVYRNPTLATELGRSAKSWVVTNFTRGRYAKEIMAVLDSICPRTPEKVRPQEISPEEPAGLVRQS